MQRLDRGFFLGDAVSVARLIAGMNIVIGTGSRAGKYMITETEAYLGVEDRACHASRGRTGRTEPMFMVGGHLYIYFIYGIHWMMNVVTGPQDNPQAVLIRGVDTFTGPGRVTRGLGIDGSYNREDLTISGRIWIEEGLSDPEIITGPRVGINYAGEPWVSKPWRFMIRNK